MEPTLRTVVDGEDVELPGSIASIRAQLADDRRDDFEQEVEHAEATQLPGILARWALTTVRPDWEDVFGHLERGEDIGARPADSRRDGSSEVA